MSRVNYFNHWTSRQGMTLIEVMIASALIMILLLATFTFSADIMRQAEAEKDKSDFIIDSNLGLQKIWPTLAAMKPSMNNIQQLDDNGQAFFDYRIDTTSALVPDSPAVRRILILNEHNEKFDFLVDDVNRGTTTLYNPAYAYDADRIFNNRELVFEGIDNGGYISNRLQPNPAPPQATLGEGQLLLFHSPILLKNVDVLPETNYNAEDYVNQIPRNFTFLGHWGGGVFTKNTLNGLFNFSHPIKPTLNIDNIDEYFRYLPPSLAGGTFTAMTPVTAYRLVAKKTTIKITDRKDADGVLRPNVDIHLFRYNPGYTNFPPEADLDEPGEGTVLFKNVRALKLMRDHIASPVVRIEVVQ